MGEKQRGWCDKKGCQSRSQGVKIRENACNKVLCLCLFGVGAIIYLAVGFSCLFRGINALKINADFEHNKIDKAYDSCQVPVYYTGKTGGNLRDAWDELLRTDNCKDASCPKTGTNWTTVWMFNGVTMIL